MPLLIVLLAEQRSITNIKEVQKVKIKNGKTQGHVNILQQIRLEQQIGQFKSVLLAKNGFILSL